MKNTTILSSVPGRRVTELVRLKNGDNRDSDKTDLPGFFFFSGGGGGSVGLTDLEPSNNLQRSLTLPLREVPTVSAGVV